MAQIENEFTYRMRHDPAYLSALAEMHRNNGFDIPLFTCEKPWLLRNGWAPGLLPCSDFGSDASGNLAKVRAFDKDVPFYVPEFYPGWMTDWGNGLKIWPDEERREELMWEKGRTVAAELLEIAAHGAGFSYYMFHGGTNFGFWAPRLKGHKDTFHTTSYDYQAPISEEGLRTCKYYLLKRINEFIVRNAALLLEADDAPEAERLVGKAVRAVVRLKEFRAILFLRNLLDEPNEAEVFGVRYPLAPKEAVLRILVNGVVVDSLTVKDGMERLSGEPRRVSGVLSDLRWEPLGMSEEAFAAFDDSSWIGSRDPLPLASFGVARGFGWYRTVVEAEADGMETIGFPDFADRLALFVDGVHQGTIGAFESRRSVVSARLRKGLNHVALLVEDRGRYCFGEQIDQKKGVLGATWRGAEERMLTEWEWSPHAANGISHNSASSWKPLPHRDIRYPHREADEERRAFMAGDATAYRASFTVPVVPAVALLVIEGEPDPTEIYLNGEKIGIFLGWDEEMQKQFDITRHLVSGENRLNLTTRHKDRKVLPTRSVSLFMGKHRMDGLGWRMGGRPDGELWRSVCRPCSTGPMFHRAGFELEVPAALSIGCEGLSQGHIILNGHNLGRYNEIGPQKRLFAPACWTRAGMNELLVFEEGGRSPCGLTIELLR